MSHFFVGMTLAYTFICCRAQTDLTLVPGSSGEDVVDACIQKLSAISLFTNDYGFLKRIALFESKFGSNSTVINANPTGGIWQITTAISQAISSGTTSQAILDQARLSLGNDVTNFADGDFSIPLKSALAARLYVEYIQLTQISPATVYEQAIWWSQYYNLNGQSKYFQTTVTDYEYTNKCSVSKAHFYFLLDGSGSITSQNFKQSLKFIDQLASEFSLASCIKPTKFQKKMLLQIDACRNYTPGKGYSRSKHK
ncbi:uncharacterized protein LOC143444925 [Clavelina lepadiformis]|uniref:uncharacterized protein LOC143444925 n=1 Tax=Clavelina lepadiformis TaxID=159417 RepID=UPI0040418F3E